MKLQFIQGGTGSSIDKWTNGIEKRPETDPNMYSYLSCKSDAEGSKDGLFNKQSWVKSLSICTHTQKRQSLPQTKKPPQFSVDWNVKGK